MIRSVLDFIVILPDYFLVGGAPKWAAAPLDWNLIGQSPHPPAYLGRLFVDRVAARLAALILTPTCHF
jgi:hypothetical protein